MTTLENRINCGSDLEAIDEFDEGTVAMPEGFNDWGGRGYDDFVPGEVTKTAPSGDETT